MSRFDPDTETFASYALSGEDVPDLAERGIWAMAEDQRGSLWVACEGLGPGLYGLEPGTAGFRGYDVEAGMPKEQRGIFDVYPDSGGILWLGTHDGLVRFDPATGDSIRYRYKPDPKGYGGTIKKIASDKSGKLWLATTEGPILFDPVTRKFARSGGRVPSQGPSRIDLNPTLYADPGGTIWMGSTSEGVNVYNPGDGTVRTLRHDPADRYSLSNNEVWSIVRDREGNLWLGVKGGGLNRLSARSTAFGAWRHSPGDPNSLSDDNVRAIYGDRNGSVWLGTYNGGLNRFEPESGKFVRYRHDPGDRQSLDDDRVYSVYVDRSGTVWAGTSAGINRLDRKSGSFRHFSRDESALDAILFT